MDIKINLKIFIIAIIFYITKQIEMYALIMFFAIIHELGHLICGLVLGLKPKALKIMPLGISVQFKIKPEAYNKRVGKSNMLSVKKAIISLAGPITNFLIAIISYVFCNLKQIELIIYANILLGIFNLLPIYPLDGGRCIKNILRICCGNKISMIYINKISNITLILLTAMTSILILYYKNIAIAFIVCYLWGVIIIENKKFDSKMKVYKTIENYDKKHLIKT
ncbi:MAG: hypothetical protein HFJ53_07445 [Clostridia bacterium]|jgi:stage IV sporulation protein FB|nr:hypothetical protein [Clostridia bacterium]